MNAAREAPIVFTSEGQQVVGIWHRPAGAGPFPAVLLLHGFTGHKGEAHRLFVQAARALAAGGMAALRIDFRGSGDSAGEFHEMTIAGELADARAALRFLRDLPDVDAGRIGVLGMSMGGMVTAFLLAEEPALRAAVLWNPVGNPKRLRDDRYTPEKKSQLETTGVVDLDGWPVGAPFIVELGTLDPLRAIVKAACPVLVIQADRDETVPLSEGEGYLDALRAAGREVALHIVRGADHTFNSLAWTREVVGRSQSWFAEKLAAPPA